MSVLFLTGFACSPGEPPPPDVSGIKVDFELLRFDRPLMNLDTADIPTQIDELDQRFGEFADVYFKYVIPMRRGDFSPDQQLDMMKAFLSDPLVRSVDSLVNAKFPDETLAAHIDDFREALRYYRHYVPSAPLPDTVVAYLSQFELAGFLYGDGDVAVGLDYFLGPDFDYQSVDPRQPIFSGYLARTYTPRHLPAKLLRLLIEDHFPAPETARLIDRMMYEGKVLHLLDRCLPTTPDSVVLEVTEAQTGWLGDNEIAIYAHLQEKDLLYSSDPTLVRKLTQPAPYTQGMPRESPGRAPNYLGLQIVRAYLAQRPQTTIAELFAEQDGQRILAGARYKPKQ